jgi:hypothetical protein
MTIRRHRTVAPGPAVVRAAWHHGPLVTVSPALWRSLKSMVTVFG